MSSISQQKLVGRRVPPVKTLAADVIKRKQDLESRFGPGEKLVKDDDRKES